MSLADLLNQATPGPWKTHGGWASHKMWTDIRGSNGLWVAETTHLPEDAYKDADGRLIALAPDMARLLIDMADHISAAALIEAPGQSVARDLLARFAALDAKTGEQT